MATLLTHTLPSLPIKIYFNVVPYVSRFQEWSLTLRESLKSVKNNLSHEPQTQTLGYEFSGKGQT